MYHTYATLIKRGSRQSLKLDEGSRCVAPSAVSVVAGFKPLSRSVPGSDICGLWSIVSGATGVIAWDSIQESYQCQRVWFFYRMVFLASLDCILGLILLTCLWCGWVGTYFLTLVAVGNLLMLLTFLVFSFAGVVGMLSYRRHDAFDTLPALSRTRTWAKALQGP